MNLNLNWYKKAQNESNDERADYNGKRGDKVNVKAKPEFPSLAYANGIQYYVGQDDTTFYVYSHPPVFGHRNIDSYQLSRYQYELEKI
jgi:hypothetical protein